jgi:hypothetical protein
MLVKLALSFILTIVAHFKFQLKYLNLSHRNLDSHIQIWPLNRDNLVHFSTF